MTLSTHAGEEGLQDQRAMEANHQLALAGRPVRPECLEGRDLFRSKKFAQIERERA